MPTKGKYGFSKHQIFWLFSLLLFSPVFSYELQLILTLKSALENPSATVFNTWEPTTNKLCNFSGITCNPDGYVQVIELSSQYLSGEVPFDSICEMKSLEKLSLGKNSIAGVVKEELNKCVNLKYLDLGNNLFHGTVPDLSHLNRLTALHLNNSGFSGEFPWDSLLNMSDLAVLSVGDNAFEKTPFPEVVLSLKKMNWLYLSNCSIQGSIPAGIGNLTEMGSLELADNFLEGEIPVELTKLNHLWRLELYDNYLTGKLPGGLSNLSKLEYFDASNNHLHGDLSELRGLNNLISLQLFTNGFTGEVPPELGEFRRLVNLSLYENYLTGELPQTLGYWSEFDFIDVSENYLSGPIPPDMCRNGNMKRLLILQNNFTGGIPATYADCLSLVRFRVSNNSLSGEVPSGIWGLPKVGMIDIALNQFTGQISDEIGKAVTLNGLRVNDNRLSGHIPAGIGTASNLVEINLGNNQFTGEIPVTIGELNKLSSLHLQSNQISGSIPESIGSCISLSDVNMANNSISGEIPSSLGSLPALNSLNLAGNHLAGPIPKTLSSLKLSQLDLSNNHLSGPIPDSLTSAAYNGSFAGNDDLCSIKIAGFRRCSSKSTDLTGRKLMILILSLFILIGISLLSIPCYSHIKRKGITTKDKDSWDLKSFHVLTFKEDEILNSIKQENHIGKGGSGNVYKVSLANGHDLAVKHVSNSDNNSKNINLVTPMLPKGGRFKTSEFDAEVQTLSSIRHVNVVKLYCSITSEDSSLLVYEFMPNGSLWDRLHNCGKMALDWETRYEIALGAAKGLEYLHHGCDRPIIHRDVKSSNILLDECLKPKIADFGLAKILQVANPSSRDSTQVIAGTHGYIAPEYGYTYKVTEKSDVYSFGVVLMELVSGKQPINQEFGDNKDIVDWVYEKVKSREKETILSMVDSTIQGYYREEALKVLRIAIECSNKRPSLRPTMRGVVQMLQEAEPSKLVTIKVNKDDSNKDLNGSKY